MVFKGWRPELPVIISEMIKVSGYGFFVEPLYSGTLRSFLRKLLGLAFEV